MHFLNYLTGKLSSLLCTESYSAGGGSSTYSNRHTNQMRRERTLKQSPSTAPKNASAFWCDIWCDIYKTLANKKQNAQENTSPQHLHLHQHKQEKTGKKSRQNPSSHASTGWRNFARADEQECRQKKLEKMPAKAAWRFSLCSHCKGWLVDACKSRQKMLAKKCRQMPAKLVCVGVSCSALQCASSASKHWHLKSR